MLVTAITHDDTKALAIISHRLKSDNIIAAQMNQEIRPLHTLYRTNPGTALDLIMFLLINLIEYYNIGKSMSASQIEELGIILCENYRNWTIDDFALCFKKAKVGEYGKVYDRLDGGVINDWCQQYDSNKSNKITDWHLDRKQQLTIGDSTRSSESGVMAKSLVKKQLSDAVTKYNLSKHKPNK